MKTAILALLLSSGTAQAASDCILLNGTYTEPTKVWTFQFSQKDCSKQNVKMIIRSAGTINSNRVLNHAAQPDNWSSEGGIMEAGFVRDIFSGPYYYARHSYVEDSRQCLMTEVYEIKDAKHISAKFRMEGGCEFGGGKPFMNLELTKVK